MLSSCCLGCSCWRCSHGDGLIGLSLWILVIIFFVAAPRFKITGRPGLLGVFCLIEDLWRTFHGGRIGQAHHHRGPRPNESRCGLRRLQR